MLKKRFLKRGHLGYAIIVIVAILLCQTAFAQGFTPNVRVNDVVTDFQAPEGGRAVAILGDTVYVVWSDARATDDDIYFAKSTDGGATFGTNVIVSSVDTLAEEIPSITVDASGIIYVTWLSIDSSFSHWWTYFAKSTDGGASFSPGVMVDSMAAGASIAVYGNNVYILYGRIVGLSAVDCYFARSTDGGASFGTPYKINDAPPQDTLQIMDGDITYTDLSVDASGNIYAVWADGRRSGGNQDIYFAKSTDNGVSFGTNVPVNDTTGAIGDSMQISPSVAVSGSNVYVVWLDYRSGERRIYFAKSTDGGATFGVDIPVNDTTLELDCWRPSIASSASGLIYVAYAANKTGTGQGIWCTESDDSGATFYSSVAVSDAFNDSARCPSITVDANNVANVVWSDERTGSKDVYFAKGTVTGIEDIDLNASPITLELLENNPFIGTVSIRYILTKSAHIELAIYNIGGQLIKKLFSGEVMPGTHIVTWNGTDEMNRNVRSGIYFCHLRETGGIRKVRKILLLK